MTNLRAQETLARMRRSQVIAKWAGYIVMSLLFLSYVFRESLDSTSPKHWYIILASALTSTAVLVAYWKTLTLALSQSLGHGCVGMILWPYLLVYGFITMRGWHRVWPSLFAVGLAVVSLLKWKGI